MKANQGTRHVRERLSSSRVRTSYFRRPLHAALGLAEQDCRAAIHRYMDLLASVSSRQGRNIVEDARMAATGAMASALRGVWDLIGDEPVPPSLVHPRITELVDSPFEVVEDDEDDAEEAGGNG